MNTEDIISLKCPNCSAPVSYYTNKCEYCGCFYAVKGGVQNKTKLNYEGLISGVYMPLNIGISGSFY